MCHLNKHNTFRLYSSLGSHQNHLSSGDDCQLWVLNWNSTLPVDSVKAEAVINGRTLEQSRLTAHVPLAWNIQPDQRGLTCSQGSKVKYTLKYGHIA